MLIMIVDERLPHCVCNNTYKNRLRHSYNVVSGVINFLVVDFIYIARSLCCFVRYIHTHAHKHTYIPTPMYKFRFFIIFFSIKITFVVQRQHIIGEDNVNPDIKFVCLCQLYIYTYMFIVKSFK